MATGTNYLAKTVVVPYDKQMSYWWALLGEETPLSDMLNAKAGSINAYSYRWLEENPMPRIYLVTDLSASGSTSTTALAFTQGSAANLGASTGRPYYEAQKNDLYQIDDEIVRLTAAVTSVTAASGATNGYTSVTVARGACGTTAATHAAYTEVKYAGNASDIDRAWAGATNAPGVAKIQYVQRFAIDIDHDTFDDAITSDPDGGGARRDAYVRPKEFAKKFESALIRGKLVAPTSDTKFGTFDGLVNATTAVTSGLYTSSGITQAQFEGILDAQEDLGAKINLVLTGSIGMKALNGWYRGEIKPTQEVQRNMKRVKWWLPSITGRENPIRIVRHKLLSTGEMYFLDTSQIDFKYLWRPRKVQIAEDGGGDRWMLEAAAVMGVRGKTFGQGKITNLTGSA